MQVSKGIKIAVEEGIVKWSSIDTGIETAVEEGIEEMVIDKYMY